MKKTQKVKTKHNKKRNTAFLYEALVAEIAKAFMEGKKEKREKLLSIVKEFFGKGKPLHKELTLYKSLNETRCRDYNIASRFLNEMKREYAMVVTNEDLYGAQSKLIGKVNKEVSPAVYNNFVPNYKNLATIYQIFNHKEPKTRVIFEEKLIEHLCEREETDQLEQLDSLTYRLFLKKFNEQYGSNLLESQKKALTYYVMSFSDDSITLKSFLNEEIGRLKKLIEGSNEIKEDETMGKKAGKVLEFLNSFHEKEIDENKMQRILEIQALAEEILSEEGEKTDEN